MSNREIAISLVNTLSEEKLQELLTLFADDATIARIETDLIANDKNRKRYANFEDIVEEVLRDE